jgi:hypothetical protein
MGFPIMILTIVICIAGDKKEEKKGLLAKFGLDDWKFALPAGLLVGIPAVANEVSFLPHFLPHLNTIIWCLFVYR